MTDCLFCKIIAGEIPSTKVYEDEFTYAFEDISPQAAVHVLLVPKKHVENLKEATKSLSDESLSACLKACTKVAELKKLDDDGFRIVSNCGEHACQSVEHFHIHVLGGNPLSPKMG